MKTYRYTIALTVAGLLAVAAAVAGVSTSVGVDGMTGFVTVFAIIALAATEYGFGGRRLFSK